MVFWIQAATSKIVRVGELGERMWKNLYLFMPLLGKCVSNVYSMGVGLGESSYLSDSVLWKL